MYAIIGIVIGLLIHICVIRPIERKRIHERLIKDGIIPKENDNA